MPQVSIVNTEHDNVQSLCRTSIQYCEYRTRQRPVPLSGHVNSVLWIQNTTTSRPFVRSRQVSIVNTEHDNVQSLCPVKSSQYCEYRTRQRPVPLSGHVKSVLWIQNTTTSSPFVRSRQFSIVNTEHDNVQSICPVTFIQYCEYRTRQRPVPLSGHVKSVLWIQNTTTSSPFVRSR